MRPSRAIFFAVFAALVFAAGFPGPAGAQQNQAGSVPQALAVGDFNRDGLADLAVANAFSDDVSILLGDAAGGFLKVRDIPVGVGSPAASDDLPRDVAAADLDGDGFLDLVVSTQGFFFTPPTITILLGLGDAQANFSLAGTISIQGNGQRGFPSDGADLPEGAGTRAPAGGGNFGFSTPLAIGDFTGDGRPDIALGLYGPASVHVLAGDGAGNFSPIAENPIMVPAGDFAVEDLAMLDLNRDGRLEIVGVTAGRAFVIRTAPDPGGAGGGAFVSGLAPLNGADLSGLAAGDFDGDGRLDVAVSDRLGSVRVLHSLLPNGSFRAPVHEIFDPSLQGASDVQALDFDGDGTLELAVPSLNSNAVAVVAPNLPPGAFAIVHGQPVGQAPRQIALRDLNHDGLLDILTANEGDENNPMNEDVSVVQNPHSLPAPLPLSGVDMPFELPSLEAPALARATGLGASMDGHVWVANWFANQVVEIGPEGEALRSFDASIWGVEQVSDIAPDFSGSLAYVTDRTSSTARLVDLHGGAVLNVLDFNVGQEPGDIGYRGVAWDQNQGRLFLASPPGFSAIVVGDEGGAILDLLVQNEPLGDLAFDIERDLVFSAHPSRPEILAYSAQGPRRPEHDIDLGSYGPEFANARGAAVAAGFGQADFFSEILVATAGRGLLRFDAFGGGLIEARNLAPGARSRAIARFEGSDGETCACLLDLGDPPAIVVACGGASDGALGSSTRVYSLVLSDATFAPGFLFEPGAVAYDEARSRVLVMDRRRLAVARFALEPAAGSAFFEGFFDYEPNRPPDLRHGPILGAAIHPATGLLHANVDGQIVVLPEDPNGNLQAQVLARLSLAGSPADLAFHGPDLIYSLADAPAIGRLGEPGLSYLEPGLFQGRGPGGVGAALGDESALVNDPETGRLYFVQLPEVPAAPQSFAGLVIR